MFDVADDRENVSYPTKFCNVLDQLQGKVKIFQDMFYAKQPLYERKHLSRITRLKAEQLKLNFVKSLRVKVEQKIEEKKEERGLNFKEYRYTPSFIKLIDTVKREHNI